MTDYITAKERLYVPHPYSMADEVKWGVVFVLALMAFIFEITRPLT